MIASSRRLDMNITNFSRRQGGAYIGVCGGKEHKTTGGTHELVEATNLCAAKPSTNACAPACRLSRRQIQMPGHPLELPDWDKGVFITKAVMEQSSHPIMQ